MARPTETWQAQVPGLLESDDFGVHLQAWREVTAGGGAVAAWVPDERRMEEANVTALAKRLGLDGYPALWRWSQDRARFWGAIADGYALAWPGEILTGSAEDPRWFEGAQWNMALQALGGSPDAPALVYPEAGRIRTMSRGELAALVGRLRHGLVDQGLAPGDRIALFMPMDARCVALYLAIVQAGMAVVSIPDSFSAQEVAMRLRLGDAKMIATVSSFERAGKEVALAPRAREAASGRTVLLVDEGAEPLPGELSWQDMLADGSDEAPLVAPDTVSNVLFSSGTTGEPKAIPWTHLTPLKAAMDGRYHQDIHAGDVVAWPTNIGWMMGPWLIYAALLNGAAMALYDDAPTGEGFLRFVDKAGVTMLGVVPALVKAWRQRGVRPHCLRTVRTFSSTGEASNPDDVLYLMSLASYRAPVIEYCGGTEIGGGHLTGTVVQPAIPSTFTTPALGIDLVVLDDAGDPVGPGAMGEVYLRPPSVGLSQRLLNRDHHAEYYAGCPRGPGGEVLRRHGDEVAVVSGGWRAQGRADDTMNLGGIKVGSIELENAMAAVPGLQEVAAVAVPPAGGGADRLVVFAVLDHKAPHEADGLRHALQAVLRARINPLFKVHDAVVVDALPRTASNKVMRRELRARYQEPRHAA